MSSRRPSSGPVPRHQGTTTASGTGVTVATTMAVTATIVTTTTDAS